MTTEETKNENRKILNTDKYPKTLTDIFSLLHNHRVPHKVGRSFANGRVVLAQSRGKSEVNM